MSEHGVCVLWLQPLKWLHAASFHAILHTPLTPPGSHLQSLTIHFTPTPPPPLQSPPLAGGGLSFGPKSLENTGHQRRQRKILQGAEADLHSDTMVQFCGAIPPPPVGGTVTS